MTCRKRRKKCSDSDTPCGNCARLGVECSRNVRIVWEDEATREGMRKRGPRSSSALSSLDLDQNFGRYSKEYFAVSYSHDENLDRAEIILREVAPPWLAAKESTDMLLLDHYLNHFSKFYPTFSGPDNPFVKVLLPLAFEHSTVMESLLLLGGAQSWTVDSIAYEQTILRVRARALRGCRELVASMQMPSESSITIAVNRTSPSSYRQILLVLASCGMLMLYEKLAQQRDNFAPHLQFLSQVLTKLIWPPVLGPVAAVGDYSFDVQGLVFMQNLFVYNDLVQATSSQSQMLSKLYLDIAVDADGPANKFYFPHMIARASIGDEHLIDKDFVRWTGRLDWLPSFALAREQSIRICDFISYDPVHVTDKRYWRLKDFCGLAGADERAIIVELYRVAGMVFRRQRARWLEGGTNIDFRTNLPAWGIQLMNALNNGSEYDNMLLWPIGIIARELSVTCEHERQHVLRKLQDLKQRYNMPHFGRAAGHLIQLWKTFDLDAGEVPEPLLFG